MLAVSEEITFHRDAARVAREQSKRAAEKDNSRRAYLWKKQAEWHDIEANRLEDNDAIETQLQETALLFAKECFLQGMPTGYLMHRGKAELYILHTFMGQLNWSLNRVEVPNWLPVYTEEVIETENQHKMMDRFLRPLQAVNG